MEIAAFKDYTSKLCYLVNSDCLCIQAVFASSAFWTKLLRAYYNSTWRQK